MCLLSPNRSKEAPRSEEHTSELQSRQYLVCRLLLEKNECAPRTPQTHAAPRLFCPDASRGARALSRYASIVPGGDAVRAPIWLRISTLFFNDTATTEIYTLSLHDALPISVITPFFCKVCRTSSTSGCFLLGGL